MAKPDATRFEFECYDVGQLYTLKHFADRGFVYRPFIQFVQGILGGIVRVGLEDSLNIGPGKLATSNAEQVNLIRGILESLRMQIATPVEAREMLGLKGKSAVNL